MTTDERIADALERIAGALEKIAGTSDAATWSPPAPADDEWQAGRMAKSLNGGLPVFHAVRPRAGRLVTACAASGRGGEVATETLRSLTGVPRLDLEAWRCGSSGCREVFARYPASTESS